MCRTQSQARSRPEGAPVQWGEVRALSQGPKLWTAQFPKAGGALGKEEEVPNTMEAMRRVPGGGEVWAKSQILKRPILQAISPLPSPVCLDPVGMGPSIRLLHHDLNLSGER